MNKYGMIIQWSEEDQAYVVSLPDFPSAHTHGDSYEEAAQNGKEVLDLLIETLQETHSPLPPPRQIVLALG
jgi:predicted RNase H-like HicB family nuclease